jgi:hypothetical protein
MRWETAIVGWWTIPAGAKNSLLIDSPAAPFRVCLHTFLSGFSRAPRVSMGIDGPGASGAARGSCQADERTQIRVSCGRLSKC